MDEKTGKLIGLKNIDPSAVPDKEKRIAIALLYVIKEITS